MDAHLLEEKIIQETQQAAYSKFSKTVPAYEERQSKFQNLTSELKENMKMLKKTVEKAVDKVKKLKLDLYPKKENELGG